MLHPQAGEGILEVLATDQFKGSIRDDVEQLYAQLQESAVETPVNWQTSLALNVSAAPFFAYILH